MLKPKWTSESVGEYERKHGRKHIQHQLMPTPPTRNEVLEEVAKEIEKMTAFGNDTIASFTVYIRNMKH